MEQIRPEGRFFRAAVKSSYLSPYIMMKLNNRWRITEGLQLRQPSAQQPTPERSHLTRFGCRVVGLALVLKRVRVS